MSLIDVKKCWEGNAEAWTDLSRKGYNVSRDQLILPAFLRMLPNIEGMKGLDIGCGEGHDTREIAHKGAFMTGLDISGKLIHYAQQKEKENSLTIHYLNGSSQYLSFYDETFDFCIATLSLMDMPDQERVVSEVYRVLKHEGFFQFSISHPCFNTPLREWVKDERGEKVALVVGDYYKELKGEAMEWTFGLAPAELKSKYEKFKVPTFTRTLSSWLNLLTSSGFILEEFDEPFPDEETSKKIPYLADGRIAPLFLLIRCRKR